jgi:Lhr-like helicase
MPDVLDELHPLIAGWFRERFGAPTDPQRAGWPRIAAGEDVLIAAPTGSGKTLAAFLACLDALVRRGLREPLGDHTEILYISPLKALSNDVHRNLEAPLAELTAYAAARGERFPEIRVAVRTGDTPPAAPLPPSCGGDVDEAGRADHGPGADRHPWQRRSRCGRYYRHQCRAARRQPTR